jgi:hypothetical protein
MPVTVVVEDGTGVANANSYVSLTELKDYFAVVPDAAAFLAQTDDVLSQYAVWATRVLDQKTLWQGYRATTTQALEWPRNYVTDKYGNAVAADSVPAQVKAVTCELARWLKDNDPADGQDVQSLKQITVDVVDIVFQDQTTQTSWPTIFNQIIDGLGRVNVGARGFPRVVKA